MRLGDLVLPSQQRDPRQNPGEEFCYVDIASVDNEAKTIVVTQRIVGADAPSRARKVIRRGDVIVSTVRPNLNAVALVPDNLDNQICSTGFSVLSPSSKVTSGYLFAFVRSSSFIDCLVARTTGANYPAVNDGEVKDVPISVPPLAEQERLVKLLDEADELRKLRAQADRRTANLIPALFHEMFGDPDENLKSWLVFPFGELLAEPLRNGLSPAKDGRYRAKVLTLSAITGKGFDGSAWKEASFARLPDKNCQTTGHLFLICRGNGNRELVGRAKFSQYAAEGVVFPDTMIAGVPKTDRLLPLFLEEAWNLPATRGQISSGARTTNGTFKINQTVIEQIRLPVPPLTLQKEFAARVSEIRAVQAEQSASRRRLDDLFQSLLHRAFKGEL